MKSAIIGSGLIAGIHAQALTSLGHTIQVVVNPHQENAAKFAEQWHASSISADLGSALDPQIDCVHVCTPPLSHPEIIERLLSSGKHVICEKPLCFDAEKAEQLHAEAEAKGLVNAVVFNCRSYDAVIAMHQMIQQGELGRICLIHGAYQQEYHALPDAYTWRYQPDKAGKMRAVTEIGSHWFDLASYITGLKIDAVSAAFGCFTPERTLSNGNMYLPEDELSGETIEVASEDAASITMQFADGVLGSLLLSEVSHGRGNQLRIEIIGTKKSVWWDSERPGEFYVGAKGEGTAMHLNAFNGGYPETFRILFEKIYADIAAGHPDPHVSYPNFMDGAYNAAVCCAVYDSAHAQSAWKETMQGKNDDRNR